MTVDQAIRDAEAILPGEPAPEGEDDPRWQALIMLGDYVASDPEPLWQFCRRWGSSEDPDLRGGIAACILEHLLEFHFELIFPRIEAAVRNDPRFADCFSQCWDFGQTREPENRQRFDALKSSIPAV